ncbi:hypothetical protein R3P38DRAFT_3337965 [Favolaschia claudopus]|uniref:Uncharacterized protein n=1 Tax=Favolaschia claudopus TaxID=2862362 RepID=A0AAV9YZB9_9AGAR
MEFRLCLRNAQHLPDLSPDPRPPLQNRYTGLGFRSIGFIPDLADYEIYVELRRRFLSSPRGRCACFAGGVIGRLARSEITDEDLDFHKGRLAPREENVLLNEIRLWDGHSSTAYWDDALEDQEIDLICGVYEIATGRFENGEHQTSRVSWWPKPNAFSHSGLNIGFWSLDCEYWFQHRLAKIRSGEEKVHTQAEWKNCIRYYRKARDLAMANERIAGEFLSGVL